jgi:hypothetical protein
MYYNYQNVYISTIRIIVHMDISFIILIYTPVSFYFVVKKELTSNFMKIRLVGTEFRAGGRTDGRTNRRTDMTTLIVAFCNFANEPKMQHGKFKNH